MTLKVGVIGAGIGGLSAAIALRRTGAQVEIFERSNFQNEIGAAITITPNGMRVLQTFGFDATVARGVENKQMRMVDPYTLKDQIVEDFRGIESDYGAPFMFFHRVDLHTALKNLTVSDTIPGPPAVIRNGQRVKGVHCETGKIELENGRVFEADLVVIADGVHLRDAGFSFYRCLIPFDELNKHNELASIFADQDPGFWVPFELSTGTFLVTYPCRDGKMLNIAFKHATKPENEEADEWNTNTNIEEIISMVDKFNPLLPKLLSLASSISVHKVFKREPLKTFTRGRAVIIGDAAHPIQPTHAQGAVLAIEEAAALEVLFTGIDNSKDVTRMLTMYNDILKRRIHATQLLSDAQPGLEDVLRQRAEDVWGQGVFPASAMNFTKPVRDFFYGWDVMSEARDIISRN
ncbi:hypothetical protein FLONG3_2979 [Fusarium longipes]|uniref:FAD-binding domain-containing protein n=1 Tax=Fusarium longipes TaxID=694270 RepID=A0A395T282_9HYPO|nr:hypothetical protein FLONG3_2979 [Fusarium longipes]